MLPLQSAPLYLHSSASCCPLFPDCKSQFLPCWRPVIQIWVGPRCGICFLKVRVVMLQVLTSPAAAAAARTRSDTEAGGCCRRRITAAWRNQRGGDLRTAPLQVRPGERKRTPKLPPTPYLLQSGESGMEREGAKVGNK